MIIILKGYKISPKKALKICGYVERKDKQDFIREDHEGRFHAKVLPKALDIHYDLYVEHKHVVFDMPIKCNTERHRIIRKISWAQVYQLKEGERMRLMRSYC